MQFQQTLVTKETTKIWYYLWIMIQLTQINNNYLSTILTLSYPWITTLHLFYFTTIHRNVSLFSQDRSWLLTELLYHVLRVDYYFCLATKINVLQLKYSHLWHSGVYACFCGDSPTWRTCHNLPAWVHGLWHKPNWRQIHVPGNWHPAVQGRGATPEGIAYWQMLHYYYNQPP